MEDFQIRVIDERDQLSEKLDKLDSFIESDRFQDLHWRDRHLLTRQAVCMQSYKEILDERINRFKTEEEKAA